MNQYKETYIIRVGFSAENDEEANKITEKNLNAILSNGEFFVEKFKIKRRILDDVDNN